MKHFFKSKSELRQILKIIYDAYSDEIIGGKDFFIEVSKVIFKRSLKQNALYWGYWLNFLELETGQEKESLHEYFKRKFLSPTEKKVFNDVIYSWSTTKLNTVEFMEYLEKIRIFVHGENGYLLPYPDEKENFELFQKQIKLLEK